MQKNLNPPTNGFMNTDELLLESAPSLPLKPPSPTSKEFFELIASQWAIHSTQIYHQNSSWLQCQILIQSGHFELTMTSGRTQQTQLLNTGNCATICTQSQSIHLRCLSLTGQTLSLYTGKLQKPTSHRIFNSTLVPDLRLSPGPSKDPISQVLESLQNHCISTDSVYFMNQLFSGIWPETVLAEKLIAQTKTTLATQEASPVFSQMEKEIITSLADLLGWPLDRRQGIGVPGGSSANFMAVHCARHCAFPEVKEQGMIRQACKIFVSQEAHYSFKKAAAALGLGLNSIVEVPTNAHGQMIPEQLDALIQQSIHQNTTPLLVGTTSGTTVTGAFDPIAPIALICKKYHLWLHVDAAWGGPVIFSQTKRSLMQGVQFADSITFDAHKLLGAGITCSFFLTQHPTILQEANDVSGAQYLFHAANSDPGRLSWQCGRRADAVSFWAIWKSLGTNGIGAFVDHLFTLRQEVLQWIKDQPRLILMAQPQYLNLCIKILPPASTHQNDHTCASWTLKVRETLKAKNLAFVNFSEAHGETFLRLILAHPKLTTEHVTQILQWALDLTFL
jgi:glutamate decarboxylase/sulfinoalanine decarboxylase